MAAVIRGLPREVAVGGQLVRLPEPISLDLPPTHPTRTIVSMKLLLCLLTLIALSTIHVQAQCKDCGCKEKCSPKCSCQHDQKPKAQ